MRTNIKIGTKIKVINDRLKWYGDIGTIIRIGEFENVIVDFEDQKDVFLYLNSIEITE